MIRYVSQSKSNSKCTEKLYIVYKVYKVDCLNLLY